jgi:hypothetical protein
MHPLGAMLGAGKALMRLVPIIRLSLPVQRSTERFPVRETVGSLGAAELDVHF